LNIKRHSLKKCGDCKYFRRGRNIYEEFCVHPEMVIACDKNNTEYCVLYEKRKRKNEHK